MKDMQSDEVLGAIFPGAIKDNADFTAQVIDAKDAEYIEFEAVIGATDIAMATLKVMESDTKTDDTTLGGSPTEVVDVTTKPGVSDGSKVWIVGVDYVKGGPRKRYVQLQAKAGNGSAGTYLAAIARVRRSGNRGSTAADRGVANVQYA